MCVFYGSHKGETTTRDGHIKGTRVREGIGCGGASARAVGPMSSRVLSRPVVGTSGVPHKIVLPWDKS